MAFFINSFFWAVVFTMLFLAQTAIGAESWQAEWEKTVNAAKKEGRVIVYGAANQGFLALNAGVFQKRFPASRDIRTSGPGNANMRGFYANPKLGPQFIRRLYSEMDITIFRDGRQGVDWLATGKFPICFFCTQSIVGVAKRQGLPIESFGALKEGQSTTASGGSVALINRAPNPNAARVLINWLLSREGQLTVQQEFSKGMLGVSNSLRIDIPKDMLPTDERLEEGVEYIDTETAESLSLDSAVLKVFNEALAIAAK